jgi:hypothetical protein
MKLVGEGRAVHYDKEAVRAISLANELIIFGCPPA